MNDTPDTQDSTTPATRKTRTIALDAFGNAIPEVPLARVEGTGKALKIVETREIIVTPPKRHRKLKPVEPEATQPPSGWVNKLRQAFRKRDKASDKQAAHDELVEDLSHRLEHAFVELKKEFAEREQQLEHKLSEVKRQHVAAITEQKQQKKTLKIAAGVAGAGVVGYLLMVLTNMGGSMNDMTANMSSMNGHISTMSGDTQVMTQSLQQMNDSMSYMNYNVDQLNNNVGYMNQNVGQMNQSIRPIGEVAQTASPIMGWFKNFMPF